MPGARGLPGPWPARSSPIRDFMLEEPSIHRFAKDSGTWFPIHYPSELPITSRKGEILGGRPEPPGVVSYGRDRFRKEYPDSQDVSRGRSWNFGLDWVYPAQEDCGRHPGEPGGGRVGPEGSPTGGLQDSLSRLHSEVQPDQVHDGWNPAGGRPRGSFFRAYSAIIVDEAHERTLNIDFLLGILKGILPKRPDLRVIITSATINPEKFSQAFGGAPILEVSGRTYSVRVVYRPLLEGVEDPDEVTPIDQVLATVHEIKTTSGQDRRGDILVFMPTESDIRETVQRIEERRYHNTLVMPLFGRMAASDQQRIFQDTPQDKIVAATNIAETSITIPRIKYVVDTGLARISQYNSRSGTRSLPVVPISRASADQRKGRCGRVGPGTCFRLYSEEDYLSRRPILFRRSRGRILPR